MSNTNKNKLVNLKEKYNIELDRVRNKLEQKHIVAMSEVNSNHQKILNEIKKEHRRQQAALHKQKKDDSKHKVVAETNLKCSNFKINEL